MKKLLFAIMLMASALLFGNDAHAQAWRPRTQTQVYTTPNGTVRVYRQRTYQPYVYQQNTRTYSYQPYQIRTYRYGVNRGVLNARAHGGVAHAYGLRRERFARMNRER